MLIIFSRKFLSLLGGLIIIIDFTSAGMVPIKSPGNAKPVASRPATPLAKPVNTPGINPNANRPGIPPNAQPAVSFGGLQQKPPPGSYSSSQSSVGNSQSHSVYTSSTIGATGGDPVMIISSTQQNVVNETENSHNVPMEQMVEIFNNAFASEPVPIVSSEHILEPSQNEITQESTLEQSPSPDSSDQVSFSSVETTQTGDVAPNPNASQEPSPSVPHDPTASISSEMPPIVSQEYLSNDLYQVPSGDSNEQLQTTPQEHSPSQSSSSPVAHNADTVSPSVDTSPVVAQSATNGIVPNPNIHDTDHHFDLEQYLAQATLVFGDSPQQGGNEIPEGITGNSVSADNVVTPVDSVQIEVQAPPPDTSSTVSISDNEPAAAPEDVQFSAESQAEIHEEPSILPVPSSSEIHTDEMLGENAAPEHVNFQASPVDLVAEVPVDVHEAAAEHIWSNEISAGENIVSDQIVNPSTLDEQFSTIDQAEVSQDAPPNVPVDHSEHIDSRPQGESDSQHHVDSVDEHLVLSEVLEAANAINPSAELPPTSSSPELEVNSSNDPAISEDETNTALYINLPQTTVPAEGNIASGPAPESTVSHYTPPVSQVVDDDDDPPFNVEQYLAQAALILGSSRYRPYVHKKNDKLVSANELYYSNGKNTQASSDSNDSNLVKADQFYSHSSASVSNDNLVPAHKENSLENGHVEGLVPSDESTSSEKLSHPTPTQKDVVQAAHIFSVSQPLLPHLQLEELDEDSMFMLANPVGEAASEDDSFSTVNADQSLDHPEIQSVVDGPQEDSSELMNDIEPPSEATEVRARPVRPGLGMARPSALGIAPVYTYSGGKLNTPVGEDIKLTHGSLSTANSKNQNGTFSMLHDIGKAPQHAMVSLLGSTAYNSYFNGSQPNMSLPTNTPSFSIGPKPSLQTESSQEPPPPPKVQHTVLNSSNIVGSLDATPNKPTDSHPAPTLYQNYYFPQESVKFTSMFTNNGGVQPVVNPSGTSYSEASLIPQLVSEVKSFQDDSENFVSEQSVLDLLAQDRKKTSMGINGASGHLVKRTATGASRKNFGRNATANEDSDSPDSQDQSKVEDEQTSEPELEEQQATEMQEKLNTESASQDPLEFAPTEEQKEETGSETESVNKSIIPQQKNVHSDAVADTKDTAVSYQSVEEHQPTSSNEPKEYDDNVKESVQNQQSPPLSPTDNTEVSKTKQQGKQSEAEQSNTVPENPSQSPAPPSPKDAAAGPSGPSLPELPAAPTMVAPPPVPEVLTAPSLSEISIPEPNINTPEFPKDVPGMIGAVNLPSVPTIGDSSKGGNNKGLPTKPKPPKRPHHGPGKGTSQQGPSHSAPQPSIPPVLEQQQPMAVVEEIYTEPEELAATEEVIEEESESEVSEEADEAPSEDSYNESNDDNSYQGTNEQSFTAEKAMQPPKHGRPFPPGFATANPNPAFANPPHGPPPFQAPAPLPANSKPPPEKGCSCSDKNNNANSNKNPNTSNSGGKNNGNENNGGDKNNASDNGGKNNSPGKNNQPSQSAPAPTAAPPAPKPAPVIDVESEPAAAEAQQESSVRPPRPTKPKRPKPNPGNKKPKPKPSGDKHSEKLKDVAVEDEIDVSLLQQNMANYTNQVTDNLEMVNKLETDEPSPAENAPAAAPPAKQTELLTTISVFGWEIPVFNWAFFTDIFQSLFVEKFRTSSGEFTCDESDNDVTILRSELDVDYLCGDDLDLDYSRRDIIQPLDSNVCNMFCNSNGFSGGRCMPQKSCLCYMSEKKNFAIKLDRLLDFNTNSTEKVTSEFDDTCQNCRCLKSCQNHGKYVGYCSKSCHCGVPWYNENSHQEIAAM